MKYKIRAKQTWSLRSRVLSTRHPCFSRAPPNPTTRLFGLRSSPSPDLPPTQRMGSRGARGFYGRQRQLVGEGHGGRSSASLPSVSQDCSKETTQLPPQPVKEIQSSGPSGHKAHPSTKAKVPVGPRVGAEGREARNVGQKHPPHTAVTVSLRNCYYKMAMS